MVFPQKQTPNPIWQIIFETKRFLKKGYKLWKAAAQKGEKNIKNPTHIQTLGHN